VTLVIAVDGPAGSGKSSAAKGAARALGLRYLDTGSMYRAMTWWMLHNHVPLDDPAAVTGAAATPVIEVGTDPSAPIRTRQVSNSVSAVASVPAVRRRLVELQREIIGAGGIVVEGRDIGSVVAPDAGLKIFLTASDQVRAQRRAGDLLADPAATVDVTLAEQARRDKIDSTRKDSPLAKASDAVEIDSTALGLDEVIEKIVRLAKERQ
jgi:CMP/dCMP kinase